MTRHRRLVGWAIVAALAWANPAVAYLHLSTFRGATVVPLRWAGTRVSWAVSDRGVPGVSASDVQAAVARAFATWEAVPSAAIGFQYVGPTSARPLQDDTVSVVGFLDEPEQERVLGATSIVIDTQTGTIVEADIFLNAAFPWSTSPNGSAGAFDVQAVATHEIGHLLGLGHSALGETVVRGDGRRDVLASASVMFPIALGRGLTLDRVLQPDDVAGISVLYPEGRVQSTMGSVRGRVRLGDCGFPGAHVVVFNPATGALVGGFALGAEGEFQIGGLSPGSHAIRVEPLDDGDVESFLSSRTIDLNFLPAFHDRLVIAPRGGTGPAFDVVVRPK